MRNRWTWFGMLVFIGFWTAPLAHASCAQPEPPQQLVQHSDAVFGGEVTNVPTITVLHKMFNLGYPVTFRVLESWKGITTTMVTLKGHTHHSLAVSFEPGQQYLVYAYYEGGHGRGAVTTNGCKGTKVLAGAAADLDALGPASMVLEPVKATRASTTLWLLLGSAAALLLCCTFVMARRRRRS